MKVCFRPVDGAFPLVFDRAHRVSRRRFSRKEGRAGEVEGEAGGVDCAVLVVCCLWSHLCLLSCY